MAAYTNKFTVESGNMVRIVFVDERLPPKQGLPMPYTTAAEVVMTRDNAKALGDLLVQLTA